MTNRETTKRGGIVNGEAIGINEPLFNDLRDKLDDKLKDAFDKIFSKAFDEAAITVSIGLSLADDFENFPGKDANGENVIKTQWYQRPNIDFKVTLSLKQKFETKGTMETHGREIRRVDDVYVLVPVEKAQVELGV